MAAQASAKLLVAAEQALGGFVDRLNEAVPSLDSCALSLAEPSSFASGLSTGAMDCSHTASLHSVTTSAAVVADSSATLDTRDPVQVASGMIGEQLGVDSASLAKLVGDAQ